MKLTKSFEPGSVFRRYLDSIGAVFVVEGEVSADHLSKLQQTKPFVLARRPPSSKSASVGLEFPPGAFGLQVCVGLKQAGIPYSWTGSWLHAIVVQTKDLYEVR